MIELNTPQGNYPVSAILFDKDGTLLQFVSLWGSWGECFLDQFTWRLEQRGLSFLSSTGPPSWEQFMMTQGRSPITTATVRSPWAR